MKIKILTNNSNTKKLLKIQNRIKTSPTRLQKPTFMQFGMEERCWVAHFNV
jgi:hypothetical protein